jgi:hypothetical protein
LANIKSGCLRFAARKVAPLQQFDDIGSQVRPEANAVTDLLELVRCEGQIPNLPVRAQWAKRLAIQSHFQAGRVANP